MEINHFITQFQLDGQVSKFQEGNSKDQILASMMKQFLERSQKEKFKLFNKLTMFQKKHQSMVINLYTTLFQVVGLDNKSQVGNLKDQILVLMMKLYLKRSQKVRFKACSKLIMFLRKHQFMVIRVHIIQYQLDGLDSRSQVDSLRGQILDSMMRLFLARRNRS